MANSDNQKCDICSIQHVTSEAIVWCPECEENFCEKCKLHHTVAKATRKHETIAVENVSRMPQFVRDIEVSCSEHDERFIFFCSEHELPCCVECIKRNHSHCQRLTSIQNIAQDIKSSTAFTDLETLVEDILTNIGNMTKDQTEYKESLGNMKSKFVQDLKATRSAVNNYFDKLEHHLLVQIEKIFAKEEIKIGKLLYELASRTDKASETQEHLGLMKSFASDIQTFLAMHEITKSVDKEERQLKMLLNGGTFRWITFTLQPVELKVIEEHVSCLGEVHVQVNPCKLKSVFRKVKEAQLIGKISNHRNIQDISSTNKMDISLPILRKTPMASRILPNRNSVFTDLMDDQFVIRDNKGNIIKKKIKVISPFELALSWMFSEL